MIENEDTILIKNYLDGDEKSLEILIAKYLKQIYNFVYRNIGNQIDSEDITQEIFLKVWKNIKKFDQEKNFKPWIFQIAKNSTIDFLRKKKTIPFSNFENEKGQNLLIESLVLETPDLINELHNKQIVNTALKDLNRQDKKIIDLRHSKGMSFREISDFFNESINTIKSKYRRIIKTLKTKNSQHQ